MHKSKSLIYHEVAIATPLLIIYTSGNLSASHEVTSKHEMTLRQNQKDVASSKREAFKR